MQDKQDEEQASKNKKINKFTITAIVMASVSFLIDPFSILSIIGIVFAAIGLAKSNNAKNKTWAIISLVISIMETIVWFAVMGSALAAL